MSLEQVPAWTIPEGGLTADALDHMPGLPPHTELLDGGLVLVNPQRFFHMRTLRRLETGLLATVPADLEVVREMSVVLSGRQRPEPDIAVIDVRAIDDDAQTWYPGDAVLLVVEVVSPESQSRDRLRKPHLYAAAGIGHFWRVEENDGRPVVFVHELDLAKSRYRLTGIYHDRIKLTVPYEIDIDLESGR